ncbi:FkbM family methyltransferase [Nocardioides sp.]|uniref:FkbM family methyltransferase n=1 Tax=Nocardioides sp. TaxID=35761 RepID=UPI002B9A98D0|nr:FkbM family methyltransferase [Nocardioides sp.]HXH77233.1 FkbM family methyltransferase [Nocardioides sp.]
MVAKRSRGEWLHRWPEGRVSDSRRWGTISKWATNGTDYDMFDLLWRHYKPQPGDTVIDVGAGHGGETFFLADMVGPAGKVLAIEAAPKPYARLVELIRVNGWSQIEPLQLAVSNEAGKVMISDEDDWVEGNVYSNKGAPVRAVTLDDLCAERGITQVDWMKMNNRGRREGRCAGHGKDGAARPPHDDLLSRLPRDGVGPVQGCRRRVAD